MNFTQHGPRFMPGCEVTRFPAWREDYYTIRSTFHPSDPPVGWNYEPDQATSEALGGVWDPEMGCYFSEDNSYWEITHATEPKSGCVMELWDTSTTPYTLSSSWVVPCGFKVTVRQRSGEYSPPFPVDPKDGVYYIWFNSDGIFYFDSTSPSQPWNLSVTWYYLYSTRTTGGLSGPSCGSYATLGVNHINWPVNVVDEDCNPSDLIYDLISNISYYGPNGVYMGETFETLGAHDTDCSGSPHTETSLMWKTTLEALDELFSGNSFAVTRNWDTYSPAFSEPSVPTDVEMFFEPIWQSQPYEPCCQKYYCHSSYIHTPEVTSLNDHGPCCMSVTFAHVKPQPNCYYGSTATAQDPETGELLPYTVRYQKSPDCNVWVARPNGCIHPFPMYLELQCTLDSTAWGEPTGNPYDCGIACHPSIFSFTYGGNNYSFSGAYYCVYYSWSNPWFGPTTTPAIKITKSPSDYSTGCSNPCTTHETFQIEITNDLENVKWQPGPVGGEWIFNGVKYTGTIDLTDVHDPLCPSTVDVVLDNGGGTITVHITYYNGSPSCLHWCADCQFVLSGTEPMEIEDYLTPTAPAITFIGHLPGNGVHESTPELYCYGGNRVDCQPTIIWEGPPVPMSDLAGVVLLPDPATSDQWVEHLEGGLPTDPPTYDLNPDYRGADFSEATATVTLLESVEHDEFDSCNNSTDCSLTNQILAWTLKTTDLYGRETRIVMTHSDVRPLLWRSALTHWSIVVESNTRDGACQMRLLYAAEKYTFNYGFCIPSGVDPCEIGVVSSSLIEKVPLDPINRYLYLACGYMPGSPISVKPLKRGSPYDACDPCTGPSSSICEATGWTLVWCYATTIITTDGAWTLDDPDGVTVYEVTRLADSEGGFGNYHLHIDSPRLYFDLVIEAATETIPANTISSATYTFLDVDVGKTFVIKAGTGFTAGSCTIQSVVDGMATLGSSPGTVGSTAGIGYFGGDDLEMIEYDVNFSTDNDDNCCHHPAAIPLVIDASTADIYPYCPSACDADYWLVSFGGNTYPLENNKGLWHFPDGDYPTSVEGVYDHAPSLLIDITRVYAASGTRYIINVSVWDSDHYDNYYQFWDGSGNCCGTSSGTMYLLDGNNAETATAFSAAATC